MSISIVPVGNKLIVLPDPKKEKTESGIIIPDSANEATAMTFGTVIATSKELSEFKDGDRIFYVRTAGVEIEANGIKYRFLEHQPYNSPIWGIDVEPKLSAVK
jgi:chaperonin GroES